MSCATQPAIAGQEGVLSAHFAGIGSRKFARRLCQAIVLLPLFSLVLLPEYVQGLGDPETKSILYRAAAIGPLRVVDGLLLILIAAHVIIAASLRRKCLHLPPMMAIPGLGFLAAIAMAMIYGWSHGGTNLFFDWRALALGFGIYCVFAMWVQSTAEARSAMQLFAGYMALRIGLIYALFLQGGGNEILGLRIPVFDGPTLSAMVFTAVLASWMGDSAPSLGKKVLWMGLCAAACLLVLLCFRRTFWAELGFATVFLLIGQKRRRIRKLLLAMAMLVAVATTLGPTFYERMQSLNFTDGESEFSQGNPDHVGDVLDAWEQVRQQPLLGIGLGRSYQTLRIQDWKEESVMVHNAPLHVWLKYGLMGLACYVWFHFAVFRWLRQRYRALPPEDQIWPGIALAYLAAQFAVSLGFAPWPYSSVQSTTLISFVLAVAVTGTAQCKYQPYRSSLPR